ncbi:hypothetical protein [Streptomyces sp. NPDC005953]|uniref:hypothetical protein n=1 Tax=unclassified Streptomyces TaxID=2593676 RepID=UPI0033DE3B94
MRIRTALAGVALAGALFAGVASPVHASESLRAPAVASATTASEKPVEVLGRWYDHDWYFFYDRCMAQGKDLYGRNNVQYRCLDIGFGRYMLQYYV